MKISDVYNTVLALLNSKPVFDESDDEQNAALNEVTRLHERERFLSIYALGCRFLYPVYLSFCKTGKAEPQELPEDAARLCDPVFYPAPFIPALCALCAYLTEYRAEHRTLYENELKTIFSGFDPVVEHIDDVYENV